MPKDKIVARFARSIENAKAIETSINIVRKTTLSLRVKVPIFPCVKKTSTKEATIVAFVDFIIIPTNRATRVTETVTAELTTICK